MDTGLGALLGFAINLIALVSYWGFVRSDSRGFRRFLAFWIGMPLTFFMKLFLRPDPDLVLERKLAEALPPPEEDIGVPEYVREEVRAIRQRRLGNSPEEGETPDEEPGDPAR
jgi:hypothetical protein